MSTVARVDVNERLYSSLEDAMATAANNLAR